MPTPNIRNSKQGIKVGLKKAGLKGSVDLSFHLIKGTVSVISSDPRNKDGNVRFITVPFKGLSELDQGNAGKESQLLLRILCVHIETSSL